MSKTWLLVALISVIICCVLCDVNNVAASSYATPAKSSPAPPTPAKSSPAPAPAPAKSSPAPAPAPAKSSPAPAPAPAKSSPKPAPAMSSKPAPVPAKSSPKPVPAMSSKPAPAPAKSSIRPKPGPATSSPKPKPQPSTPSKAVQFEVSEVFSAATCADNTAVAVRQQINMHGNCTAIMTCTPMGGAYVKVKCVDQASIGAYSPPGGESRYVKTQLYSGLSCGTFVGNNYGLNSTCISAGTPAAPAATATFSCGTNGVSIKYYSTGNCSDASPVTVSVATDQCYSTEVQSMLPGLSAKFVCPGSTPKSSTPKSSTPTPVKSVKPKSDSAIVGVSLVILAISAIGLFM